MAHDIKTLPKWAQRKILDLQQDNLVLKQEVEARELANDALKCRSWIRMYGPTDKERVRKLFYLDKDNATPACYLYHDDILVIGRKKHENTTIV